jgi:hypothetical protein
VTARPAFLTTSGTRAGGRSAGHGASGSPAKIQNQAVDRRGSPRPTDLRAVVFGSSQPLWCGRLLTQRGCARAPAPSARACGRLVGPPARINRGRGRSKSCFAEGGNGREEASRTGSRGWRRSLRNSPQQVRQGAGRPVARGYRSCRGRQEGLTPRLEPLVGHRARQLQRGQNPTLPRGRSSIGRALPLQGRG